MMATNDSPLLTMLDAVYISDLNELGRDKFCDWLKESFSGPDPAAIGPYFIDDELDHQTFGDLFSRVVPKLSKTELESAKSAVIGALADFDLGMATFEGLYNLSVLAENLEATPGIKGAFQSLEAFLEPTFEVPSRYAEAYFLRETFEVLFRYSMKLRRHDVPSPPKIHEDICSWAYKLATEMPYPEKLKFALAPIYVMGRMHVADLPDTPAKKCGLVSKLESSLLDGYQRPDDPFPEFFQFKFGGERFPYDIERIGKEVEKWLRTRTPASDKIIPVTLSNRFSGSDPLQPVAVSATSGELDLGMNDVSSREILEARRNLMVGAEI